MIQYKNKKFVLIKNNQFIEDLSTIFPLNLYFSILDWFVNVLPLYAPTIPGSYFILPLLSLSKLLFFWLVEIELLMLFVTLSSSNFKNN